jgi:hypothetical protein
MEGVQFLPATGGMSFDAEYIGVYAYQLGCRQKVILRMDGIDNWRNTTSQSIWKLMQVCPAEHETVPICFGKDAVLAC